MRADGSKFGLLILVGTWLSFFVPVFAQGVCDHYLGGNCVDAYGSREFAFEPLFKEPPSFGYGFRVYFFDEYNGKFDDTPAGYNGDVVDLHLWMSYGENALNINPKANRTTDVAFLLTNATGNISCGNNGCDGLLGRECAANLKDILTWSVFHSDASTPTSSFSTVEMFETNPPKNLSCPTGLFDNYIRITDEKWGDDIDSYRELRMLFSCLQTIAPASLSPLDMDATNSYLALVIEHEPDEQNEQNEPYRRLVPPASGNATNEWQSMGFYRSAEEQLGWAVIGIAARYPSGVAAATRTYEDIQLEIVCFRAEPVEGSEDRIDPRGGGPGRGNAASVLHPLSVVFGAVASFAIGFLAV